MPIYWHTEDINFSLNQKQHRREWLYAIIRHHGSARAEMSYVFCTDEYLLSINKLYLNHNYYTDIITFDNGTSSTAVVADIFISIDRVLENKRVLNVSFEEELNRVLAHGLLHLLGFNDHTLEEKAEMRKKEAWAIKLYHKMFHVKQND